MRDCSTSAVKASAELAASDNLWTSNCNNNLQSGANWLHWSRGSVAVRVMTAPDGGGEGQHRGWADAKLASLRDATAHGLGMQSVS